MVDLRNRESIREIIENGLSSLQILMSYCLLPIALPLVFIQESVTWLREKIGLNNRTMEGKVVLITGASSGIGEALAHSFFNAGCKLILASRRREELERVKDELVRKKSAGSRVYVPAVLEMDLGDIKSIPAKAKSALGIYEGIDILINNAGILHRGNVLETDIEVDRKIMDVNYFGTLSLTKVIANHMKEKKSGHVVFMSSVQGKLSVPHSSAYAASKHAMQALADSLRAETADFGIQVTVISPGYVKTDISINALTGSGSTFGEMTSSIAGGMTPQFIATRTLKAIQNKEKDIVVSPIVPKLAIFLRYLTPSMYFYVMKLKARSYNKNK